MCLFDLGGDENATGAGAMIPFLFGLILEKAFLFPWCGMQEMSQRVARGAAPLFYCGACTESGCIHTQLLSFEGIWSTLVLFGSALFTFSSLTSPPISVFSAPAFLLENKCKLAFSHPLTVTVLFMHIVLFQVFVLLGSLYTVVLVFFFPLKVWISLEIGAWRFILWGYRLFVMTSYQNLCNHSSGT